MEVKPYMSSHGFGKLIGRDGRTVRKWCKLGYIPFYKQGKDYMIQSFAALAVLDTLASRGLRIEDALGLKKETVLPGSKKAAAIINKTLGFRSA